MGKKSSWLRGVRGKLSFLIVLPILVIMGLSAKFYLEISDLGQVYATSAKVDLPRAELAGQMALANQGFARWLWSSLANPSDADTRKKSIEGMNKYLDLYKTAQDSYIKLNRGSKALAAFKEVETLAVTWDETARMIVSEVKKASPDGDMAARKLAVEKLRGPAREIERILGEIEETRRDDVQSAVEERLDHNRKGLTLLAMISLFTVLTLIIFGTIIGSRLAKSLARVTERISGSGQQVSDASQQLSSASQQLSASATQSASSLQETVASLEELSSMVKLNADNAKEASSLSQSSSKSAESGEGEIRNLIEAMTEISKSSKKIEEIINVIDDIAFQTNLLALNAAVEAARAGEQGKGFAVVAEAVRNLAQRSASAAKDITLLIEENVDKIANGTKIADQSGQVLKDIVTSVKKVSDLNNEIASASVEQSNGITQISKAMHELDLATQRNAAGAEETAASSEQMSSQATELQGLVGELSKIIEGAAQTASLALPYAASSRSTEVTHLMPRKFAGASAKQNHGRNLRIATGHRPEDVIPFDEDDHSSAAKVGSVDGF